MKKLEEILLTEPRLERNEVFKKMYNKLYKKQGEIYYITKNVMKEWDCCYNTFFKYIYIIAKYNSVSKMIFRGRNGFAKLIVW